MKCQKKIPDTENPMNAELKSVHTLFQVCRANRLVILQEQEPRREKTGLRGFRPGPTQTGCTAIEDG